MKKIIAIVLVTLTVLFCFAGCKKKADKVAAVVTNGDGDYVAAVTKEDGGAIRDEAGNLIVVVTDNKGNVVKEDGEILTEKVIVDSAVIIGDRIEMPDYALTIPKGWSNTVSNDDLVIKKDGTDDQIKIIADKEHSFEEVRTQNDAMTELLMKQEKEVKRGSDTFKVDGKDAVLTYAYTADKNIFLGFILFENNGIVYSTMITGKRDMSGDIDDITAILSTVDFI